MIQLLQGNLETPETALLLQRILERISDIGCCHYDDTQNQARIEWRAFMEIKVLGDEFFDHCSASTSRSNVVMRAIQIARRAMRKTMKSKFNLVRQFAVLSFLCIGLLSVVSTVAMSQFLTDRMLLRDATVSNEFLQSIVIAEGTWHTFEQDLDAEPSAELLAFTRQLLKLPDVVRVNLYRADGYYIWSSDPSLIGQRRTGNHELNDALSGSVTYETGKFGALAKSEHANLREGLRFVESYMPIWNSDRSAVVGAVELYKVPAALNEMIDDGKRLVLINSILGGLLLFASLFWIVNRANRTMEAQQKKLAEAEALAMIGETASAVAHSMRNPLASIRACAELTLTDDLDGARESAQDIIQETDRLSHWARDLLHFSNREAGQLELVDINEVVTAVVNEQKSSLQQNTVRCQFDFSSGLLMVRASSAPISQVIANLVTNAVEAVGKNGHVAIATSLDSAKRDVVVTIADNGPGMPASVIEKAFRPFFTTKQTGTGLGLPLARRLIEGFDGTLNLESIEGHGTTVTVRLPAAG